MDHLIEVIDHLDYSCVSDSRPDFQQEVSALNCMNKDLFQFNCKHTTDQAQGVCPPPHPVPLGQSLQTQLSPSQSLCLVGLSPSRLSQSEFPFQDIWVLRDLCHGKNPE